MTLGEARRLIAKYKKAKFWSSFSRFKLADVIKAADRASEQVAAWPEWKRNL